MSTSGSKGQSGVENNLKLLISIYLGTMNGDLLSTEVYYPLSPDDKLTGRIGDYWWEDGEVKYKKAELKDCAPPGSLYTNYERVVTVKVLADPPESLVRRLIAKE